MSVASRHGAVRQERSLLRAGRVGALAVVVGLLTVGCVPLFFPPVPSSLPEIEPKLLVRDVRVVREGDLPVVVFTLRSLPADGWLAVQWFPPTGVEVASASVWLTLEDVGREIRAAFPTDVERVREGRWRVVLSWDGEFVRQREWSEPTP